MVSSWFRIALFNLLIAATLGVLMRYIFVQEVPGVKFMNILHAHSHVALMGWGFLGIFTLIVAALLGSNVEPRNFRTGFWIAQLLVIGMLISFPIQGYGPVSITISSLLVLVAYYLLGLIWSVVRINTNVHPSAAKFLKTAILWFFISTIGLWAMGPISMGGWKGTSIYFMSIQFFLHFQINGWFIFAFIGLMIQHLNKQGLILNSKSWNNILWLLIVATILTYALAISWSNPSDLIFSINSIGVIVQLFAMILFFKEVLSLYNAAKKSMTLWVFRLIGVAFICLAIKVLIQTAVVLPPIAVVAYTIRNFVIGFLHLVLLGMLSHFILAEGFRHGFLSASGVIGKVGMALFFIGFLGTELLLFLQGTMVWFRMGFMPNYYAILFAASLLLPFGIIGLLFSMNRTTSSV